MTQTTFRNASGLPDPDQLSTARDMATLARRIIADFPNEYRYFSMPYFVFHGHKILNHDMMLQSYPGADGLKTGYTNAAGHNLTTSAVRGDVRLVGVVLGANSNYERDAHMMALLDAGFEGMGVPVAFAHRDLPPPLRLMASAQAAPRLTRASLPVRRSAQVALPPAPPAPPPFRAQVDLHRARCAPGQRCPA